MAQLVKDFRSRTETAGFSRCPRCRQRGVQRSTFLVSQVVPFVVRDEVDDGPIGESRRLVQDEATFLDASS